MKRTALILLLVLFAVNAPASELCSMMDGKCQDACTSDQYAEIGVFEDCKEDQECCVDKTPSAADTTTGTQDDGSSGGSGKAKGH